MSFNTSFSQGYIPFIEGDKMWTENSGPCLKTWGNVYTSIFNGDTIINSVTYKKISDLDYVYQCFIREDTIEKKVFCILPDFYNNNCEFLLYDFSLQVGDTFCDNFIDTICESYDCCFVVSERTTEFFAGRNRTKLVFELFGMVWYEGIGCTGGIFRPRCITGNVELLCYFEDSTLLYHNTNLSSDCFVYSGPVLSDKEEFKVLINDHELNINTNSQTEFYFELFDITGRKGIAGKYKGNTNVDLSELCKGIYIYNIRGDDSANKVSGKVFVSE